MNKFVRHMNFYFIYYVYGLIILIILITFLSYFIPDYIESLKPSDHWYLESVVNQAYEIDEAILNFNDEGIAILKMDTLYSPLGNQTSPFLDPIYNDQLDQCAGYIIVHRNSDNTMSVDLSHVCDMIDY